MPKNSRSEVVLGGGRRVTHVRLFIHQPKLHSGPIEWVCSIDELFAFAERARQKARTVEGAAEMFPTMPREEWARIYLNENPNDEDCAFCRARPNCPAANRKVEELAGASFSAVTTSNGADLPTPGLLPMPQLEAIVGAADFVEGFLKAARGELERRLISGEPSTVFGIELGRQGNRRFADEEAAETLLRKKFRLSSSCVYKMTLKSPTQIEKLTKTPAKGGGRPLLSSKQWAQIQALTVRADPVPSVKRAADINTPYAPARPEGNNFSTVADDEQLY